MNVFKVHSTPNKLDKALFDPHARTRVNTQNGDRKVKILSLKKKKVVQNYIAWSLQKIIVLL